MAKGDYNSEDVTVGDALGWVKKNKKKIYSWAAGFFGGVALLSALYTVRPDSEGVIKRLGNYSRTTQPGLHLKIPYIESVTKVPLRRIQKQEFGYRTLKGGERSEYLDVDNVEKVGDSVLYDFIEEQRKLGFVEEEGTLAQRVAKLLQGEYQMLTGDLNVADVEFIVQYKIKDSAAFLFNVKNQVKTIRDLSEVAMRQVVGDSSVDEALTIGRIDIQVKAKEKLQEILDNYNTGIHVVDIKLQSVNPPRKVRPAFNEVNEAKQDREKIVNKAWEDYNTIIPKATGDAERMVKEAEAYSVERINEAKGDAERFVQVWREYTKAKDVTRKRMYLETLAKLLPKIETKWLIEQKGAEGGLLLKLDLEEKKEKEKGNVTEEKKKTEEEEGESEK